MRCTTLSFCKQINKKKNMKEKKIAPSVHHHMDEFIIAIGAKAYVMLKKNPFFISMQVCIDFQIRNANKQRWCVAWRGAIHTQTNKNRSLMRAKNILVAYICFGMRHLSNIDWFIEWNVTLEKWQSNKPYVRWKIMQTRERIKCE